MLADMNAEHVSDEDADASIGDAVWRWLDGPILWIALGGAVGACLRFLFTISMPTDPGRFPWTTFAENVFGAFLLGLVMTILLERVRPIRHLQPFLCTGVLGSFTTFSNFSVELVDLAQHDRAWLVLGYVFGSTIAGLFAAVSGVVLARWMQRSRGAA